mgnify:CR=1 FL=1
MYLLFLEKTLIIAVQFKHQKDQTMTIEIPMDSKNPKQNHNNASITVQ